MVKVTIGNKEHWFYTFLQAYNFIGSTVGGWCVALLAHNSNLGVYGSVECDGMEVTIEEVEGNN